MNIGANYYYQIASGKLHKLGLLDTCQYHNGHVSLGVFYRVVESIFNNMNRSRHTAAGIRPSRARRNNCYFRDRVGKEFLGARPIVAGFSLQVPAFPPPFKSIFSKDPQPPTG